MDYRHLEFVSSFDDHSNGIIERTKGTYKYFPTAYGKKIIAAGLTIRNLVLVPALT